MNLLANPPRVRVLACRTLLGVESGRNAGNPAVSLATDAEGRRAPQAAAPEEAQEGSGAQAGT